MSPMNEQLNPNIAIRRTDAFDLNKTALINYLKKMMVIR